MLILTRRVGEALNIGDDVALTVLGVKGNQVRIGIDAPKNIPVHRKEIYERIEEQKKNAKACTCKTNPIARCPVHDPALADARGNR